MTNEIELLNALVSQGGESARLLCILIAVGLVLVVVDIFPFRHGK